MTINDGMLFALNGTMRVRFSDYAMVSSWVFPKRRFIEYEKSDEVWARPLGYGHEVYEPGMIIVGNDCFIHSSLREPLMNAVSPLNSPLFELTP